MVGDTAAGTATGTVAPSTITAAHTTGIARGMAATTAADIATTTSITITITTTTSTTTTTPETVPTSAATPLTSIAVPPVRVLLTNGTNREAGTVPHPLTVGDRLVPAEAQRRLVAPAMAGNPGPPA